MPIQSAQCWFSALASSNAKIIYFSGKIYGSNLCQTGVGNCYGLKLYADCRFLRSKPIIIVLFAMIFGTLSFPVTNLSHDLVTCMRLGFISCVIAVM